MLPVMSIFGWVLKGLESVTGVFFDGIGNCLGCMFKLSFWAIAIFVLLLVMVL